MEQLAGGSYTPSTCFADRILSHWLIKHIVMFKCTLLIYGCAVLSIMLTVDALGADYFISMT